MTTTDQRAESPHHNWQTSFSGETTIEGAWNPHTRRFEPIYPEDEGYDEVNRIEMVWCRSAGRYVTIPNW
jgi:hypothetical protein